MYTIGTQGCRITSCRLEQIPNYIALKRREFVARMVSPSFLLTFRHLRTVVHTQIVFEQAFARTADWELLRWVPERLLENQFTITQYGEVRHSKIRADGFFQYQHTASGQTYSAFVECDLGTMNHGQILAKCERYLRYFQTELPEARYGTRWFQVLIITSSRQRALQLWRTIGRLTRSIFFLTHFDVMTEPSLLTQRIWLRVGREGAHALVE